MNNIDTFESEEWRTYYHKMKLQLMPQLECEGRVSERIWPKLGEQ